MVEAPDVLLIDDRLVETMRAFVTASNRLTAVTSRAEVDLVLLEEVSEQHREAGEALQEALVRRGWRRPTY